MPAGVAGGAEIITAATFCAALTARGVDFVAGVPCSGLAGPVALLDRYSSRQWPHAPFLDGSAD